MGTSESRRDDPVSALDVENLYRVFLGRLPESLEVVESRIGLPFDPLLRDFVGSGEFRTQIIAPVARGGRWNLDLHVEPFSPDLASWCLDRLPVGEGVSARLREAASWPAALSALFREGSPLGGLVGGEGAGLLGAFRAGLERLATMGSAIVGDFERLDGTLATGWVWDPHAPDSAATVEFLVDGEVVHVAAAFLPRADVKAAGFGSGLAGFRTQLPIRLRAGDRLEVSARLHGSRSPLANSPRAAAIPPEIARWLARSARVTGPFRDRLQRRLDRSVGARSLTILMPVADPPAGWLEQALDSVLAQWCSHWTLICVTGAGTPEPIRDLLAAYARRNGRIIVHHHRDPWSVPAALNAALGLASGDHVMVMEPDARIEPDAVYHLLRASSDGAELVYGDELLTGEKGDVIVSAQARTAFSWDYYLCHPYFVHPVCVRTGVARAVHGWNGAMPAAAEIDFVLRVVERAGRVAHVPAILYRSRAGGGRPDMARTNATVEALNRHLARVMPGAAAAPTDLDDQYHIAFPDDHGSVLIVIPTKNRVDLLRPCIESIRATTSPDEVHICVIDHQSDDTETLTYLDLLRRDCTVLPFEGPFNYPRMNNAAVRTFADRGRLARYVLFANNDLEAIRPGWLERMRSLAARPDVGVAGATLLYPSDLVQHSGVIVGMHGAADHAHRFERYALADGGRAPGYLSSLVSTREYSAVTAACILMRSELFQRVGGFDEAFAVAFNDTDLCLRIGALGLKVINDGGAVLYHHESATRSLTKQVLHPEDDRLFERRWADFIARGDPFYSPLFTTRGPDHVVMRFAARRVRARVRPGLAGRAVPLARRGAVGSLRRWLARLSGRPAPGGD